MVRFHCTPCVHCTYRKWRISAGEVLDWAKEEVDEYVAEGFPLRGIKEDEEEDENNHEKKPLDDTVKFE